MKFFARLILAGLRKGKEWGVEKGRPKALKGYLLFSMVAVLLLASFVFVGNVESKIRFERYGKCSKWCVGIFHGEHSKTCVMYLPTGKPGSPQFSVFTYPSMISPLAKGITRFEIEIPDPRFKIKKGDRLNVSVSVLAGGSMASRQQLPAPISTAVLLDNDMIIILPLEAMGSVWLSRKSHLIVSFNDRDWKYEISGVDEQWSNYSECLKYAATAP